VEQLSDAAQRMLAALNAVIPRRSLGWRTPERAWAERTTPRVDRIAFREEVRDREARLALTAPQLSAYDGLPRRLEIEAVLLERRTVTFHNESFNTRTPKPYFLNPGSFGDDVLDSLAKALAGEGKRVIGKPEQEDFGWYLDFEHAGLEYCFVLGYRPDPSGTLGGLWIGTLERSRSLFGSILGLRQVGIGRDALRLLHQLLSEMPGTKSILWHNESAFRRGVENQGVATPEA